VKPQAGSATHPKELEVVVEVPRGGFIKRTDAGGIDYVSPIPCPFNYGSVPDTRSGDGDRLDALVLGPALARGARVTVRVVAVVRFLDAGEEDPKYVCAAHEPSLAEVALVTGFFKLYAVLKGGLNRVRGKRGATRFDGLEGTLW
jgi:inorganic pyrophosphatase